MGIDARHPQYDDNEPIWTRIDDITRQRNLSRYVPKLNSHDDSAENAARNKQYQDRAVFYGIAKQTVSGFLGMMFSKNPKFEVPTALGYMADNADGAGVSIFQQSQSLADDVIRFSRAGLYVAYPRTDAPVSRQAIQDQIMIATIHRVEPQAILNWRTIQRGAQVVLSLVVIYEAVEVIKEDGYSVGHVDQIREMFLDGNAYRERIWQKSDETKEYEIKEEYTPTDAGGRPFDVIPFTFVGAENNDAKVDSPNLETLTDINIGHFRNSADWEDSVFYAGQAQPWMSGVTQQTIDLMKKHNLYVGSRNPIMLPEHGQFGYASADPNPIVRQAMIDKIEMMVGLGAIMLQPNGPAKTATQAAGESEARHSVMSMIAGNISEAYTAALQWAMQYMGETGEAAYEINQDFVRPETSPQELQAIMAGFIQGSIPVGDYVTYMQRRGFMDGEKTIEEYGDELTGPLPAIE